MNFSMALRLFQNWFTIYHLPYAVLSYSPITFENGRLQTYKLPILTPTSKFKLLVDQFSETFRISVCF